MTPAPSNSRSRHYDGIRAADSIVAKAVGVSELAQAARIETLQRKFLEVEWNKLAREAVKGAKDELGKRSGPITKEDQDRALAAVNRAMAKWAGRVTPRHLADVGEIYELAHIAAARKGLGYTDAPMDFTTAKRPVEKAATPTIKPNFDLVDKKALAALKKRQQIWIGDHYGDNVERSVKNSVRDSMKVGAGRAVAGKALGKGLAKTLGRVEVPKGFHGSNASYFEGLAAHSATQARVTAQLNAFNRLGYTMYEVVNPQDHRTCSRCQAMDGHVFYVKDGMAQLERMAGATSPAAAKKANPYLTRSDAKTLAGGPKGNPKSTRGLARRGNALPPYHYKCRCNVDVTPNAVPPDEVQPKGGVVSIPSKPLAPRPPSPVAYTPPKPEALRPDLKKIEGTWREGMKTGKYSGARSRMESSLKKHFGITQRSTMPKTPLKVLPTKRMPKELGWRSFGGDMALRQDVARRLPNGLKNMGKGLTAGAKDVKVLVHECIHGANRTFSAAYVRGGAVITEVSTEVTARRVVFDSLGMTQKSALFDAAPLGTLYQSQIDDVFQAVAKGTGWAPTRAAQEIERASHLMNTKVATSAHSARAACDDFVKLMPGSAELTATQRTNLAKKLALMHKDW